MLMNHFIHKAFFLFLTASLTAAAGIAQAPPTYSASDILSADEKLNVLGSILCRGAHPDDENTQLLTYLSKKNTEPICR